MRSMLKCRVSIETDKTFFIPLEDIKKKSLRYEVKYLIFSSSCTVYGNPQKIAIPEGHPLSYDES